ncbi:hypothetical protein TNIN_296841 [Trichonephila inaurata madagascariensis]|uniref:Uncharacterized protein n=1 Tax=Trichonephila inaurata madagascariensis TaxID=2747483 RepID=A0A8X6XNN8_9ARAC|nr:hypothetical protein TNIN_296841 [Trichonephila inaurata madagascariensis]
MAFLGKGKKKGFSPCRDRVGEAVSEDMKVIELKQIIVGSKNFEDEFVKNLLETVMNERMESENLEKETLEREVQLEKETREREFQLECLRVKQNIVVTKSVGGSECDLGTNINAAVIGNPLDQGRYILGNQTTALLQGIEKNCSSDVGKVNTVITRLQTRQSKENEIFNESDQINEQAELSFEDGTDNLENEEVLPPVDGYSPNKSSDSNKIEYF